MTTHQRAFADNNKVPLFIRLDEIESREKSARQKAGEEKKCKNRVCLASLFEKKIKKNKVSDRTLRRAGHDAFA